MTLIYRTFLCNMYALRDIYFYYGIFGGHGMQAAFIAPLNVHCPWKQIQSLGRMGIQMSAPGDNK